MAKANFNAVMEEVFSHEGGYVNHSKDPGGETNYGISKRSYPKENIRTLTKSRAAEIYRRDFWAKIKGDELPAGVDLVTMDSSVNSGVSRGVKWTQKAAGMRGNSVDGVLGPLSLRVIVTQHSVPVIRNACSARMGFLKGLKTWGTFGKGWSRRVASVEATAIAMSARDANLGSDFVRDVLGTNAKNAEADVKRSSAAGKVSATTGGTAGVGAEFSDVIPSWGTVAIVVAVGILAIWFLGNARHSSNRVAALKAALEKVV